jgi:hypothetical protein
MEMYYIKQVLYFCGPRMNMIEQHIEACFDQHLPKLFQSKYEEGKKGKRNDKKTNKMD